MAKSELVKTLIERGFLHQCTDLDALDERATGTLVGYAGFDCTAMSLHIGNLVSIMMLRWMQKLGHQPIVLVGGGTTKVGDPSGKDASRQLLTDEVIGQNKAGIKQNLQNYIDFESSSSKAIMVDNADWLENLSYISFLREYGAHFSINRMLTFDSIKLRLEREHTLSFLEFNYMIMQAYDFLELNRRYGCSLQFGGSDQWGNIVNGVELIRRIEHKEVFGFTSPLITTSTGAKMGKTADGAVWLNGEMKSVYDFWQFWRNTSDADVGRFFKLYTELPLSEIKRYEDLQGSELNEAKKILATEVTSLCHGSDLAHKAAQTAEDVFEKGMAGDDLPSIIVSKAQLEAGVSLIDALQKVTLANSGGDARRLIRGGGARVNDKPISDEMHKLHLGDMDAEGVIKLAAGKKRYALIKIEG